MHVYRGQRYLGKPFWFNWFHMRAMRSKHANTNFLASCSIELRCRRTSFRSWSWVTVFLFCVVYNWIIDCCLSDLWKNHRTKFFWLMNCYANVIMCCAYIFFPSSLSEHYLLITLLCFRLGCWYYIWVSNSFLAQQHAVQCLLRFSMLWHLPTVWASLFVVVAKDKIKL